MEDRSAPVPYPFVLPVFAFPSPTSYLVVRIALDHYRQSRVGAARGLPAGGDLLAGPGKKRPSGSELARAVEAGVIQQSLELQKPAPTGYTGDFLTLLSSQYPDLFLRETNGSSWRSWARSIGPWCS